MAAPKASPNQTTPDPETTTPGSDPARTVGDLFAEAEAAMAARNIHQRMAAILGELPAIGKNQRNQQQGFNFRGIDDVLNALNPLLSKHGVYVVPEVVERTEGERTTRNGNALYVVSLHVRYTFYGLLGDSVRASAWGEGTDSGDKATPKAMTGAFKYALFQAFAISVEEVSDNDGDRNSPEETIPVEVRVPADAEVIVGLRERLDVIKARDEDLAKQLGQTWRRHHLGSVTEGAQVPLADVEVAKAEELVNAAEEELVANAPRT